MHKQNFFNEINLFGAERRIVFDGARKAPEQPALQAGVDAQRALREQTEARQKAILVPIRQELLDIQAKIKREPDRGLPLELQQEKAQLLSVIDKTIRAINETLQDIKLLTPTLIAQLKLGIPTIKSTAKEIGRDIEAAKKQLALQQVIERGWQQAEKVTDYDNTVIENGWFDRQWRVTEYGERNVLTTKHLYSGILTGIGTASDNPTNMNRFANETQAFFEDEGCLEREDIQKLLSLGEEMFKLPEDANPVFTMVQGYMLGLLYVAKKKWNNDAKLQRYAEALVQAKFEHQEEMERAFFDSINSDDVEEDIRPCQNALKEIAQYLPLPDQFEATQEEAAPAEEGAPADLAGLEGPATGPASVPGKVSGAEAGKLGPTGAPSTGPRERGDWNPDRPITPATLKRNEKLMTKWNGKPEIKTAIYKALGIAETIAPNSKEFAEAVKRFQAGQQVNLDLQDGVIGDQTMTAIIGPDKANEGKFQEWGVKKLGVDYYSSRSGRKMKKGKGEKKGEGREAAERQEETAEVKLGKAIGEMLAPYAEKEEAAVKADEGKIKEEIKKKAEGLYGADKIDKVETTLEIKEGKIKVTVKVTLKPVEAGKQGEVKEAKAEGKYKLPEAVAAPKEAPKLIEKWELEAVVEHFIGQNERDIAVKKEGDKAYDCISNQLKRHMITILQRRNQYLDVNNADFKQSLDRYIEDAHKYLMKNLIREKSVATNDELKREIVSRAEAWMLSVEDIIHKSSP